MAKKILIKNATIINEEKKFISDLLIVDTSGIHRGHPISKGERFATTKYMWETHVPSSVSELLID